MPSPRMPFCVLCRWLTTSPRTLSSTGLAQQLLGYQEGVASNTPPIEKVMLTCFLSNRNALKFYRKLGYVKDDISPMPRKLRGAKVFDPDFVILSKVVKRQDNIIEKS